MIANTAFTLTVALLSLLVCAENIFAQLGDRGSREAGAPTADEAGQEMSGRGRGGRRGAAGGQAGGATGGTAEKLFATIDTNQDGVITREEMKDAMRAFAKLDEDKDGKLTAQEAGGQAGGRRGASMRGRGGQEQAPEGSQGSVRRGGDGRRGRGSAATRGPSPSGKSGKGNPLLDD